MTARQSSDGAPMRVLFVNENIGGHATLHAHLRASLAGIPSVTAEHFDCPPRRGLRRLAGASVPGLDRLDLDFQALRNQLIVSWATRRYVRSTHSVPDVVHVYTQNAALLSSRWLRSRPSVVSTDATNEQNGYQIPTRRPTRFTPWTVRATAGFERPVFQAATFVVTHSEWARRSVIEDYSVAPERVRVIPFGIVDPGPPVREPTELPEITFIGTTMARKGGWRLVRAWRRHLQGRATLNLVTREAVPPEPGIRVHADFVSGDPRLPALLARTAVLAFPSEIDKSSFAILEAMAAGVPVVATAAIGGIPELVDDGATGVLVPAHDDALGVALTELLSRPERLARLGEASRARFLERFDAAITTAALVDTLREARAVFRPGHVAGRGS